MTLAAIWQEIVQQMAYGPDKQIQFIFQPLLPAECHLKAREEIQEALALIFDF
jgi:hypothetical protein